jgi:hypothetical protein
VGYILGISLPTSARFHIAPKALRYPDMRNVRTAQHNHLKYDEVDEDILDAYSEFSNGRISYEQLKANVGPVAARSHVDRSDMSGEYPEVSFDTDSLFDNPEDF